MSNLVRTAIIDKNGRATHVHKLPEMTSRILPSVPTGYRNGIYYDDYISNIWDGDAYPFTDEQIQQAKIDLRIYVNELINAMEADPEWMPEVLTMTEYDDDEEDGDGYIAQMDELTIPEMSRGQCLHVSEAVSQYMKYKRHQPTPAVQGMAEPHSQLNVHYANLFTGEGTPALIVDFTYSQVDELAEFPLIVTPVEWVEGIQAALAKL